ncbi:MAG: hypothetical protein ACRD2L_19280 [Terriglobia bacterium]
MAVVWVLRDYTEDQRGEIMDEHRHKWNSLKINFRGMDWLQACVVPKCDKERRWRHRNIRLRLVRGRTGKPMVFKKVPHDMGI